MKKTASGYVQHYFAFMERRGLTDRWLLLGLLGLMIVALFSSTLNFSRQNEVSVPSQGGALTEGIVGTPRFVNPVLAITQADQDVAALIYSGLLRLSADGTLEPDVAESVTVSEDGRTYTVTLRQDVYFHNGEQLTARDVAYTIALIQNPDLKSPLQGNWEGVLVEERGSHELNLILEEAYAPFIENLTVGILPRTIWNELPIEQLPFSQNNTQPVGSGLYQISEVSRNKSGLIDAYTLTAVDGYQAKPKISTINFLFFANELDLKTALEAGEIMATASLGSDRLAELPAEEFTFHQAPLPRTFAVYYNQNKSVSLRDQAVRQALSAAIDRADLVATVLNDFGLPNNTPIPVGFGAVLETSAATTTPTDPQTRARGLLTEAGWSQTEAGTWQFVGEEEEDVTDLTVTLSTANTPLFDAIATYLEGVWSELGVTVTVAQFEQADLVQAIIRPRDFQALLFGADIGRAVDLYPFWHSSQKDDPGLNIAQYTNSDVDTLLETTRTSESASSTAATADILATIAADAPATFLFTPTYTYVTAPGVTITVGAEQRDHSDRFNTVSEWYLESDSIWPVFKRDG